MEPGGYLNNNGVPATMYGLAKGKTFWIAVANWCFPAVVLNRLVERIRVPSINSGPTAYANAGEYIGRERAMLNRTYSLCGSDVFLEEGIPGGQGIDDTSTSVGNSKINGDLHISLGLSSVQVGGDVNESWALWVTTI